MATKIEGHTTEADVSGASGIWLFRDRVTANKATLVIHGDKHERVFTESEVRELLWSMMQLIDGNPEQVLASIEAVNAKHGLGLSDPA